MNVTRAEARRWFQQAQADMAVGRTLRSTGHHAAACFHNQRAANCVAQPTPPLPALFFEPCRPWTGHG